ncbi:hypothetical protein HN51_009536 [Arachis hypogaea]|uniref:Protein PAM68 n=1 Tax=Arachis hypogaea TaxID=3818 RepID=A0A445CYW2_ARAHY|nr:uncharacterized protein PAM68-like [Arachis hypogaea]QHO44056.1 uncharacterized protein DS421_5g167940 [Arachis hypogaea]RYR56122.1 hypothetical protein Ahy_A05g021910 [Arachis hypogaea]
MNTLICSSNPTLHLSNLPSRKPNFSPLSPKLSLRKLNYPLSTLNPPHAYNAKGFSSVESELVSSKNNNPNKNKDKDDEIPREVFNRIIVRILVSVLAPMGLGLGILYVFGELKVRHIWDMPMWVPFMTTFLTFGASTLGIAYGALSTSLDKDREGTFLGLNELQNNWTEMWQEENQEDQS